MTNKLRKPGLFLVVLLIMTMTIFASFAFRAQPRVANSDNKLSTTHVTHASPDPLVVQATANEFRWTFRLPGDDGNLNTPDDILSTDNLHVPVGSRVDIQLTSADYIYIFSVPSLNVREAAVPELTFQVSFRPTTTGTHEIMTDPMCGVRYFHDDVMGRIFADDATDFARWMREMQ